MPKRKPSRAADKLRPIVGPDWARSELLEIRRTCTHEVCELRLNDVEFGQCLRRLRQDAGLSLREVARRMGVSAPHVSDCEHGHRRFKLTGQIRFIEICRSNTH
jgi:ribosome-binding protein aMBF1 (putative translation factor)